MPAIDKVVFGVGKAWNAMRKQFGEQKDVYLLRTTEASKGYTAVAQVTSNWLIKFSMFRGKNGLQIATLAADFRDKINITSHFSYGGKVHVIDPDMRDIDIIEPALNRPFWTIYGLALDPPVFWTPPDPGP